MPRHPPLPLRCHRRGRRAALVLLATAVLGGPAILARSNPVAAASPASSAPLDEGRLKALVPAQIGAWKRRRLSAPAPTGEADVQVQIEAEFRSAKRTAVLLVSSLGPGAGAPWTGSEAEHETAEGTERAYGEAGNAVRESVRRHDGRVEVTVLRPDGVVVIARGYGIGLAEAKALAFGVRPTAGH
jgi:hypothetical protein